MATDPQVELDGTDATILRLLQEDGRMTTADLARAIHMSPTATADRVRRLTDTGVIRGYRAVVDPAAVGYPVTAFIRLRWRSGSIKRFEELLERTPAVREAHHLTGEDCYLIRVVCTGMADLEALGHSLLPFGQLTTNLVFSSHDLDRPLLPSG